MSWTYFEEVLRATRAPAWDDAATVADVDVGRCEKVGSDGSEVSGVVVMSLLYR